MVSTIIRYLYYFLFILTPLIVYSRTSELFEFNKMMVIYVLALTIVCCWVWLQVEQKRLILRVHWLYIPMLVFLLSQILSTVFSIDIHTSIFGYYGRFNGGLLSIITYFALFFVFIQTGTRAFVINCLKCAFITAAIVVLWGIPGKLGGDLSCFVFVGKLSNACWTDQFKPAERMFSTLGQPNWLGAYLVVNFFIGLWFLVRREVFKNRSTLILISLLLLVFSGILFTRSRSAMLALAVGMGVFSVGFWMIDREKIKANIRFIGVIAGIFLLSVMMFKTGIDGVDSIISLPQVAKLTQTSAPALQVEPAGNITDSFDIRKIVWEGALDLGQRYPLFGTGVETFAYAYYFTRPLAHNYTSEWDFLYNKAHNEFLNYFATTGYIGVTAYLIIIGAVIIALVQLLRKKTSKEVQMLSVALLAAYLSIHITNFFGFSVTTIQIFFYLLPAFVLTYVAKSAFIHKEVTLQFGGFMTQLTKGLIIIAFSVGIIYLGRYFLADIRYATGDIYYRSGDYTTAYELYQQALVLRYEHVYEDKYSYTLSSLAFVASSESDKKLSNALMVLADKYNTLSLRASPQNVLYWKTKAKNQYLHYQTTLDKKYLVKAIEAMSQAQKLAPTDPKLPYSQALFYSLLYDESKDEKMKAQYKEASLQEIHQALALKKDFQDGITLRKTLEKKFGR